MSADYFIPPVPNTSDPNPLAKSQESLAYSKAGVDTGELIIRGGTHYDFDWIANPAFPATLRGADMIDWYTSAWFDKYLKHDCTSDRRLLTDSWRHDGEEAAIDQPNHDGNMFSFYYRSPGHPPRQRTPLRQREPARQTDRASRQRRLPRHLLVCLDRPEPRHRHDRLGHLSGDAEGKAAAPRSPITSRTASSR